LLGGKYPLHVDFVAAQSRRCSAMPRGNVIRPKGWCYVDEVTFDLSDRMTPHNGPIPRFV